MKKFQIEKHGQIKFFENLRISADVELTNNTDGVYRGTLFEFKLNIADINKTLFQAIKYLSRLRVKGKSIPKNILLVSLNTETAYIFDSENFIKEIEQIYIGAASKDNEKFDAKIKPQKIDYGKISGLGELTKILNTDNFTKIHIDVFCVIGWTERFYEELPKATKIDLFKEFREPKHFEKFIYAWSGNEQDFKYIMDCLNDRIHKKELGAYYTPPAYCKKATELVRKAIAQVPKENDYIILDRCAGSGNLEEFLTDKNIDEITIGDLNKYLSRDFIKTYLKDKQNVIDTLEYDDFNLITIAQLESRKTKIRLYDYLFDNELSHCIVNTYELKEWLVLNERLGDKVKIIIPPPNEIKNTDSMVHGGDALNANFILGVKSSIFDMSGEYYDAIGELNGYLNNQKCNVIVFENPPYSDVGAVQNNPATKENRTSWKNSFVAEEIKKEIKGAVKNDLANLFIWSAFKFYLKKKEDSYILFSPIKYWKSQHLVNKKFGDGFLFNRTRFHANTSAISCVWWKNEMEEREELDLNVFEIKDEAIFDKTIKVKKVHGLLSDFYDKREFENDEIPAAICAWDGGELQKDKSLRITPRYNENIIGYLVTQDFGFEHPRLSTNLVRSGVYAGNGFYLRIDNYLDKLPLFAAGKYPIEEDWRENGTVFKSSDGGTVYTEDKEFLKNCFIFTCLSYYNKCKSFNGKDGRIYKNELCFGYSTIAEKQLKKWKLNSNERELTDVFYKILEEAKKTKNYNILYTYGTYQIETELNTKYKDEVGQIVFDYPELNTKLAALKTKLAEYYKEVIKPKLFKYELLK